MTSAKMPVIFIGHGSPMNMVQKNSFTESLSRLGQELPRPEAIMVVSAHWLRRGTCVSIAENPSLLYDFYGFPAPLYKISYRCPGAPGPARRTSALSVPFRKIFGDREYGLDHGAYSVLRHLYPQADIPVFEMSLDYTLNHWTEKSAQYHYALGRLLRPLRSEGILMICSGNLVHNLARIEFDTDAAPFSWAEDIDRLFQRELERNNHRFFIDFLHTHAFAPLAAPTWDHYLPVLYALGAQERGEPVRCLYEGIQNGSISMRSFRIG